MNWKQEDKPIELYTKGVELFDSLDEVQAWVLSSILKHGEEAYPRGMHTLELYPVAFGLTSARRRCITNPQRRWSLPLAIGEFCWHVSGSNKVDFIEYYAKRWKEFADDGFTVSGSCYGFKIFAAEKGEVSQWNRVLKLLRDDLYSRRAVLIFSDASNSVDAYSKDVACASSLQFLVRSGKLHVFAHMRSNDAILGLPYDVFLFTMLQELMAVELELKLGTYFHTATSLHLYERHIDLAKRVIENEVSEIFEMPPLSGQEQLSTFLAVEKRIRLGERLTSISEARSLNHYWYDLLSVLDWFRVKKEKGDQDGAYDTDPASPDIQQYSKILK